MKRIFNRGFRSNLVEYFVQVSLIILSLFIATRVDRCNQSNQKEAKLDDYLSAIKADLSEENSTNEIMLYDCLKDIQELETALRLFTLNNIDSLETGLRSAASVVVRGSYRTFNTSTYEIMAAAGDVGLIRDIELRSDLSSFFAFRNDIIKSDLDAHGEEVLQALEKLGRYADLYCMMQTQLMSACLTDRAAFLDGPHNELFVLLRRSTLRAMHLQTIVTWGERLLSELEGEQT